MERLRDISRYIQGRGFATVLNIVEMFASVQGEGIQFGVPMFFIRTFGCNVCCADCDTKYSWIEEKPVMKLSIADVILRLDENDTSARWVNFTGGEPFLQDTADMVQLLYFLHNVGWKVTCETNGTIVPPYLEAFDLVTISPKLPSMHPKFAFKESDVQALLRGSKNNQLKFVVTQEDDLEQIHKLVCSLDLTSPLILQPNGMIGSRKFGEELYGQAGYIHDLKFLWKAIQDPKWARFDVRVIPQLHTMLFGHRRGI